MILGIGIDIVSNLRIKNIIEKYGDKFKKRCFTLNEIKKSEYSNNDKIICSYAKRYAAKEAVAKALGTGLARGIMWKDIEILNNKYGKPFIKLQNQALKKLNKLSKFKTKIEVSLSDEINYSIANVVIFYEK